MSCQRKSDKPPRLADHPKETKLPVGILVDPLIVGDIPKHKNEHLRFYPCRVQERDRKLNWAGFVPECLKETTYQQDFEYRGKDPRRCRTYEFRANGEKGVFFYCTPSPAVRPFYGRRKTDLVRTIPKKKPFLIDEHAPISWSEYTRTHSRLGGEILAYDLFVREALRHEEKMIRYRMCGGE